MEQVAPWEIHSRWSGDSGERATTRPAKLLGEQQSMGAEEESQPRVAGYAETLPVEILCFIFEILADKKATIELKNCASTCRVSLV